MMRLKTVLLIFAVCLLMSACNVRQAASVVVAGSTSVQPYTEILAEEYAILYPDKKIDVQGGGSSAGIMAIESEIADIGMSSRNLKESESYLWNIEIAKDGLAIIVNIDNPVSDLTSEQIRGIYAGEITNWSEVGGADAKIHVIAREAGSGTRSAFEEMVMGDCRITPKAIVMNVNGAIRQLVVGDTHAIGFISLGLVDIGIPVKALRLGGIEATRENVVAGIYPLYRSFLFVATEEPTGPTAQFIDFIFSPHGRQVLENEGLVTEVSEEWWP
jgi:phosphate transport system substrate-binding protein